MVPATLSFACPHCHVRLTVPATLAGVTGPCPSCRESITAPHPAPQPESPAAPEPAAVAVAVEPLPPPERPAAVPEGPRIRPEPRQLPERGQVAPIAPRRTTDDDHFRPNETLYVSSRSRRSSRLVHALLPSTFIALAATIIYLLLYFYLPNGPGKRLRDARGPLVVSPRVERTRAPQLPAPPAGETPAPEATPVTPDAPGVADAVSPAVVANNLLESFLAAKDAASRSGMVEPAATVEDLSATLLKGSLPEVAQVFSDLPRQHPAEGFTDYPYRVSFFVEGRPNVDFAVLVRQRGDQSPKVYLPAFLDLVGGRLQEFTRRPNTLDPVRFHVILEPVIGCHDPGVPNADRKFTLKLLPSNFGKETARAYAANGSHLRKTVEEPDSPIRWGTRVPATVTLQWNHQEDPAKPYLELIEINSPDWNP